MIEDERCGEKNMGFGVMGYGSGGMEGEVDKGYERVGVVVGLVFYDGERWG